jgi:hypothetical protein
MSLSQQIIPAGYDSNVQIYPPKIAMQLAALQIVRYFHFILHYLTFYSLLQACGLKNLVSFSIGTRVN